MEQKQQFLYLLFEYLKSKGFEHPVLDNTKWWHSPEKRIEAIEKNYCYVLFFDQNFAKFLWGEGTSNQDGIYDWAHHLYRMSLSDDRIYYLIVEFWNKMVAKNNQNSDNQNTESQNKNSENQNNQENS